MADEEKPAEASVPAVVEKPERSDTFVFARSPAEMKGAHDQILGWVDRKLTALRADAVDLQANYDLARQHKWKSSPFFSRLGITKRRINYYEKMREAIQAGYYIIPNFPMDVFAIRVKRRQATENAATSNYNFERPALQSPDTGAPVGEGRYVSDFAAFEREKWQDGTDAQGKPVTRYTVRATDFREVEFPVTIANPAILQATAEAMALRVFDEIGIVPNQDVGRPRRGDPMIVGRIFRREGYSTIAASFVIAWFLTIEDV